MNDKDAKIYAQLDGSSKGLFVLLRNHIDKRFEEQRTMLQTEVDALRNNLKEEMAALMERFNFTETEIEAVIGMKEFQDALGHRIAAQVEEDDKKEEKQDE